MQNDSEDLGTCAHGMCYRILYDKGRALGDHQEFLDGDTEEDTEDSEKVSSDP